MFEEILSPGAVNVIESLSSHVEQFYLAGGIGLALQLGHRKSDGFDFFSTTLFNIDAMLSLIPADKVFFTSRGSLHCEIKGLRVSFLLFEKELGLS